MRYRIKKFGILLHPTSLPSPHGIGDLGKEAREMLDKFAQMGVKLWQVLPLGPTGFGDSPYASRSAFAGNEYLIDLRSIDGADNTGIWDSNPYEGVNYDNVYNTKLPVLKVAAAKYYENHKEDSDFKDFVKKQNYWLKDYALFMALTEYYHDSRWYMWEEGIKNRKPESIKKWTEKLKNEVNIYITLQFLFRQQWDKLHKYAKKLGIQIIGDVPVFAAMDSADVWTHRELFKIDSHGNQEASAGVPPDPFCEYGQLWGNPVYNWPVHDKDGYKWFKSRIEYNFELIDILRIDHFRGFESYWEVPAGSPNAVNGVWKKGPGMKLLKHFKGMRIIAEDLGFITPAVKQLLKKTNWPGMKILQFGFDFENGDIDPDNEHLPHNYKYVSVSYTGTHDNETARGWYNGLTSEQKDVVRRYFECSDDDVVWQMIRSLILSNSKYTIVPIQDILGLDNSARMNAPSTVGKFNWSYRYNPEMLKDWMQTRLKNMLVQYGRTGK